MGSSGVPAEGCRAGERQRGLLVLVKRYYEYGILHLQSHTDRMLVELQIAGGGSTRDPDHPVNRGDPVTPGPPMPGSRLRPIAASACPWRRPCLLYTSPSPRDRTRSRM